MSPSPWASSRLASAVFTTCSADSKAESRAACRCQPQPSEGGLSGGPEDDESVIWRFQTGGRCEEDQDLGPISTSADQVRLNPLCSAHCLDPVGGKAHHWHDEEQLWVEQQEKANASLQDTAGQVARFTAEAATILKGLEEAQTKVAEVLKSGADLLDGTELKGIAATPHGALNVRPFKNPIICSSVVVCWKSRQMNGRRTTFTAGECGCTAS